MIEQWLQTLHQGGKSEHTVQAYRRALRHFTRWSQALYGQDFDPARIIGRDVRDWKAHQQTVEKAAPATINQRLVALASFFAWAVKQGIVPEDPTQDVNSIRLPQRQPQGLTQRDLRRLLRAVHGSGNVRDIAMLEVLVGTGLRVGELLALQVGDVEIGERSGKLTVRQSKHGGFREVPLTRDVRHALAAYLEKHPEKDHSEAGLWTGTRGPLSNRSSVVRILDKYAYEAQIEAIRPHALRHTFATRYLAANPDDVRGLAALLGHANLNTVMIYTEPGLADLANRMERIETNG
ncbi:MAG: tyrosine-type recombinase/integrase [Chloroflexi bacterium]|nr:tyrosine-type recombinase/integrase [Chloroflexota bacterium]